MHKTCIGEVRKGHRDPNPLKLLLLLLYKELTSMRIIITLLVSCLLLPIALPTACKTKKKKPATTPLTEQPPRVLVPGDDNDPTKPQPPPIETPTPEPTPPTSPTPTEAPPPNVPDQPAPMPMPNPLPTDQRGVPIIPRTPIIASPHVIMNTGTVFVYNGGANLSSAICRDTNIKAYYVPCNSGLYCFAPKCGYFVCKRWGFGW